MLGEIVGKICVADMSKSQADFSGGTAESLEVVMQTFQYILCFKAILEKNVEKWSYCDISMYFLSLKENDFFFF